jgi:NAD(P)-dependent dehydrogenase (short-subunit alcohol dehydrogenase family)
LEKLLENKVAVIVGGGQIPCAGTEVGNGRATSLLFARNGAKVFVADLFLDRAQETVGLIAAEGGEAAAFAADVVNEADCKAIMDACVAKYGRIDILINVVGIVPNEDNGILNVPVGVWDKVLAVNLRGPLLTSRYALPLMIAQESGCIVNFSSASAFICGAHPTGTGNIAYPISKYAIIFLGEIMAAQYASKGIRVNTVVPGLMATPQGIEPSVERGKTREETYEFRNKRVPLKGGMGDAWDVAEAILFLVSEKAKHVTGETFHVAGGATIKRG